MENSVNNPQAWTYFANNDISMAEIAVERDDLAGEAVFHCQQAVEKYLKAYLVYNKIPTQKIHDLVKLYAKVKTVKNFDIDEVLLAAISDLYTEVRYPGHIGLLPDGTLPTKEKAQIYLDFAKK